MNDYTMLRALSLLTMGTAAIVCASNGLRAAAAFCLAFAVIQCAFVAYGFSKARPNHVDR